MSSGRAPGSRPPYPDGPTVSTGPARQRQRARSANTRLAHNPPAALRSKRSRAVFAEFRSRTEREPSVGRACRHPSARAIPPSAPRSQARPSWPPIERVTPAAFLLAEPAAFTCRPSVRAPPRFLPVRTRTSSQEPPRLGIGRGGLEIPGRFGVARRVSNRRSPVLRAKERDHRHTQQLHRFPDGE